VIGAIDATDPCPECGAFIEEHVDEAGRFTCPAPGYTEAALEGERSVPLDAVEAALALAGVAPWAAREDPEGAT